MSKFIRQARIKDRQARAWMTVCHAAMHLFPTEIVGDAEEVIVSLLKELQGRRNGTYSFLITQKEDHEQ